MFKLILTLFLLISPWTTIAEVSQSDGMESFEWLNPEYSDRLILITFKNHSAEHIQSTADSYHRRNDYQTTTWSEQLSNEIARDYGIKKLAEWPMTAIDVQCVVFQTPSELNVNEVIQNMSTDERIELAQQMNLFNTQADSADPYFKLQTNLHSFNIESAHAMSTGKNVIIGMIDTGVDLEHPDLIDQSSRVENFAKDISEDFNHDKHGTAVAGIMISKKNNGAGIVGIAPEASLMALKACWPIKSNSIDSVCNSYTLALALNYAINAGIKILNMSLTGPKDPILELLLNKAIANDMIIVASDNGGTNDHDNFPASMPQVIAVRNSAQVLSNSRANSVAFPGEKILTTLPYGTYDFISGSSMAAAEVSAIIALFLQLNPDLTSQEARKLLSSDNKLDIQIAINSLCQKSNCDYQHSKYAFN